MNRWRQTRTFHCQSCQTEYLHDLAYKHRLFECPHLPIAVRATSPEEDGIDSGISRVLIPDVLDQAMCGWRAR